MGAAVIGGLVILSTVLVRVRSARKRRHTGRPTVTWRYVSQGPTLWLGLSVILSGFAPSVAGVLILVVFVAWLTSLCRLTDLPTREKILTGLAVVCAVLVIAGLMVGYVVSMGKAEDVLSLDDSQIRASAVRACTTVTERIDSATGSRSQRIEIGNGAILQLIADMNAVGAKRLNADKPAGNWIADWQLLAGARRTFATLTLGTSDPTAVFEVPTFKGHPVTERMTNVSPQECAKAIALAASP